MIGDVTVFPDIKKLNFVKENFTMFTAQYAIGTNLKELLGTK